MLPAANTPHTGSPANEGRASSRRVDPRRALGRQGEQIAIKHLEARGFTPLERNHRSRRGEIDVIARDKHTLLFVEVKTRRTRPDAATHATSALNARFSEAPPLGERRDADPFAGPLSSLHRRQMMRLRGLASAWLREHERTNGIEEIRIDVIGVLVDDHDDLIRLDHLEGVG